MIEYGREYPDPLSAEDGAIVLNELRAAIACYVVLPEAESLDTVTLYAAATHAQPCWEHATRLIITSPLRQCGKTRLQEVLAEIVHQPLRTTNISTAALVRSIDDANPPTIMLDEADAVFATRRGERSEGAEDLRGVLNSGHSRGWPYVRWDASSRRCETCATFAMAILGGIGDLPDTIADRGIKIAMRRRAPGERVHQWRRRRAVPPLHELRHRLHEWISSIADQLELAEPDLPVEDRQADCWEPLIAIADAAGVDWPDRARAACIKLCGAATDPADPATSGERLLADLHAVFGESHCLYTTSMIEKLCQIEEAPWSDWRRGAPITARGLADLLHPYGIRTRDVREHGTGPNRKGLYRTDLADAWSRYLSGDGRDSATLPKSQPGISASQPVADCATSSATPSATARSQENPAASGRPVAAVAAVAGSRPDSAGTSGATGCPTHPGVPITTDGKCPLCILKRLKAEKEAHPELHRCPG